MSSLEEFRHIERLVNEEKETFFDDLSEEEEEKARLCVLVYDPGHISFHHKGLRRNSLEEEKREKLTDDIELEEQEKCLKVIFRHLRYVADKDTNVRKSYEEREFFSRDEGEADEGEYEPNVREIRNIFQECGNVVFSEIKDSPERWTGKPDAFSVNSGHVQLEDIEQASFLGNEPTNEIDSQRTQDLFEHLEKYLGLYPRYGDNAYAYPIQYAGQYQGFIYIFIPNNIWDYPSQKSHYYLRKMARRIAPKIFQAKIYSFEKAVLEGKTQDTSQTEIANASHTFFSHIERVLNVVGGVMRINYGSLGTCFLKQIERDEGVAPYKLQTNPVRSEDLDHERIFDTYSSGNVIRYKSVEPSSDDSIDSSVIDELQFLENESLEGVVNPKSKIIFEREVGENTKVEFCLYFYESKEELVQESHQINATISRMIATAERAENLRQATRRAKRKARRSAVSTVMARNMSHNVGSHVLANLSGSDDLKDSLPRKSSDGSIAWDEPLAEFNDYLRTRMDFIADVSTSSPAASTPAAIYREVFYPFAVKGDEDDDDRAGQSLLLENISGVEDLGVENINLQLKVNGEDWSEDNVKDMPFASPNGLLGTHAIYVIVENIIRNSAKHAYEGNSQDGFDITINVEDSKKPPGLIEVSIHDSLGNGGKILKEGTDQEIALTESLNNLISEDIIKDDGSLNYEGWGVREMKICAAYLRGIAPKNLDEGFEPSLLEARAFERSAGSDTEDLGYTFYLQRPKEVFILDPNGSLNVTVPESDLLREGIMYVTGEEDVKEAFEEGVEHRILVVVDPDDEVAHKVEDNANALPLRVLWSNPGDGLYESLKDFLTPDRENDAKEVSNTREENSTREGDSDIKQLILRVWEAWHCEQEYVDRLVLRRTSSEDKIENRWEDTEPVTVTTKHSETVAEYAQSSVVYDRHGLLLWHNINEHYDLRYEAVDQGTPTYHLLRNPPIGGRTGRLEREKLALEIIETGECGVMLLDERIQSLLKDKEETYSKEDDKSITFPVSNNEHEPEQGSVLEWMNVWVPRRGIDLDHPKQRGNEVKLNRWVREHIEKADFLVVHLGVLEKLYGDSGRDIEDGEIMKVCERAGVHVIVTSGRGRPPQAIDMGVRFLHYSQVAEYIAKERSKYHFCRALFSARSLRHE